MVNGRRNSKTVQNEVLTDLTWLEQAEHNPNGRNTVQKLTADEGGNVSELVKMMQQCLVSSPVITARQDTWDDDDDDDRDDIRNPKHKYQEQQQELDLEVAG